MSCVTVQVNLGAVLSLVTCIQGNIWSQNFPTLLLPQMKDFFFSQSKWISKDNDIFLDGPQKFPSERTLKISGEGMKNPPPPVVTPLVLYIPLQNAICWVNNKLRCSIPLHKIHKKKDCSGSSDSHSKNVRIRGAPTPNLNHLFYQVGVKIDLDCIIFIQIWLLQMTWIWVSATPIRIRFKFYPTFQNVNYKARYTTLRQCTHRRGKMAVLAENRSRRDAVSQKKNWNQNYLLNNNT